MLAEKKKLLAIDGKGLMGGPKTRALEGKEIELFLSQVEHFLRRDKTPTLREVREFADEILIPTREEAAALEWHRRFELTLEGEVTADLEQSAATAASADSGLRNKPPVAQPPPLPMRKR